MFKSFSMELAGRTLTVETGKVCAQANGAALLKYYADEFSYQPLMNVIKCGYGTGNKNFESANVVKAVLGEVTDELISENVIELNCNVDDMSAEDMAYATKALIENGAKDAFVTPVLMKKGRRGML